MNGLGMVTAVVSVTASTSIAAGGGDILRIVEQVQTREIEREEVAIARKKDNFIGR